MKRIEDIKEFEDIDTYYGILEIVNEVFQDRVEAHKHLVSANKEILILNNRISALENKLQQKENIIKEVRGYIKEAKIGSQEVENTWAVDICNMVLEILDKANKE